MLKNNFFSKLSVPLIKGSVPPQFEVVFGKFKFWPKFDNRGPYKIVKTVYYLKLCEENIFWLNYLFDSSKEVFLHNFRQFLENWNFDQNSTGADLTNIVKILYYLTLCFENIFWLNCLFHSSKEVFLHNFRQFLEKWIFDRNSTGADLTKIVKILYYLKLC